jgi:hypothetical protein
MENMPTPKLEMTVQSAFSQKKIRSGSSAYTVSNVDCTVFRASHISCGVREKWTVRNGCTKVRNLNRPQIDARMACNFGVNKSLRIPATTRVKQC